MRVINFVATGLLFTIVSCQQSTQYANKPEKQASANSELNSEAAPSSGKPEESAAANNQTPAAPAANAPAAPQMLTEADVMALDTVVVVAVTKSDNTAKYYSDVGRAEVTTQASLAANYQLGQEMTQAAPLKAAVGQTFQMCNAANSETNVRVHGGGGSVMDHAPGADSLAPGECIQVAYQFRPDAASAVPGNNSYNHDQGNGNSDTTALYVDVLDQNEVQALLASAK